MNEKMKMKDDWFMFASEIGKEITEERRQLKVKEDIVNQLERDEIKDSGAFLGGVTW